jgi:hypothetical protein
MTGCVLSTHQLVTLSSNYQGNTLFKALQPNKSYSLGFLILKFGITYLSLKLNKITSKKHLETNGDYASFSDFFDENENYPSPQGYTLT